jgi:hypothetical protein
MSTTYYEKLGGPRSRSVVGGNEIYAQVAMDANAWVTTLMRALEWYVNSNSPVVYNVMFEFPSARQLGQLMPLGQTVIHFEIDDIQNPPFGFGDNIVNIVYDEEDQVLETQEALSHDVNFDVGVWASDASGGITARLNAYQLLSNLFDGASAYVNALGINVEIKSFSGAAFTKEEIDNVNIYRIANMTLVLRVYSSKTVQNIPYVTDGVIITQDFTDSDGNTIPDTD